VNKKGNVKNKQKGKSYLLESIIIFMGLTIGK